MSIELDDRGKALEDEYFYRQEQELIAKMKAKLEAENASAGELDCPKCDGKLVETDLEKVKIDTCQKCGGVWFDAGELAQVMSKDKNGWFGKMFS